MDTSALAPILPGPLGNNGNGTSAEGARNSAAADFESFLTLLTAQLRNQDPLSPLDSTEFVAQLASFSAVEQAVQTNERLDLLTQQSLTGDIAGFASWIGHDVAATDGAFRATGGEISFFVPPVGGADSIQATVRSAASGLVQRQFTVTPDGNGNATWDGLDQSGLAITSTELVIELNYLDGGAVTSTQPAEVLRRVSGIRGTPDGIVLELLDGGSIAPEEVSRLSSGTNS